MAYLGAALTWGVLHADSGAKVGNKDQGKVQWQKRMLSHPGI